MENIEKAFVKIYAPNTDIMTLFMGLINKREAEDLEKNLFWIKDKSLLHLTDKGFLNLMSK